MSWLLSFLILAGCLLAAVRTRGTPRHADAGSAPAAAPADPRLKSAYRFEKDGWIFVHLEGSPSQIGFQHGYLLASEIADGFAVVKLVDTRSTRKDWDFFRQAAREVLWPKLDPEYREELTGIVDGLKAQNVPMDIEDVVALNAFQELPDYYVPWYDREHKVADAARLSSPGNCSAFVATGSYTRHHKIVIAHNNWSGYVDGERWRIVFDIKPQHGERILMDGYPGVITSDDDFGLNSAGLMVTETTISQFQGWDPNGTPEFMRSRKALQYAKSIDDYVSIMLDGNNGGYANDWLLGDNKTGEIAQFELGLKAHRLWRSKDGYFVGANFARDPDVLAKDTTFDINKPDSSPNARRARWEDLMKASKGKIDVKMAEAFVADHFDSHQKTMDPDARSICGHGDLSAHGEDIWGWPPYYPAGAVQGKATDGSMAKALSFYARMGHPCGMDFLAAPFLKQHPEFAWQAPLLRDMKAGPWSLFKAGEKQP
jgi:hypothetical protein